MAVIGPLARMERISTVDSGSDWFWGIETVGMVERCLGS